MEISPNWDNLSSNEWFKMENANPGTLNRKYIPQTLVNVISTILYGNQIIILAKIYACINSNHTVNRS